MSRAARRWGMIATSGVVALAAAAPVAWARSDQELRDVAAAREQRADLAGAYKSLTQLRAPLAAERAHRQHLAATLHALVAAQSLIRNQEFAAAVELLDSQIAKLDPIEDSFLIAGLTQQSIQAGAIARNAANQAADKTLDDGDDLMNDEEWAKAAAVYKTVATKPAGSIDAKLREDALVRQLEAERKAAMHEPGAFMSSVVDTALMILRWVLLAALPVALLLALLGIGRLLRRYPKSGRTSIALIEVVEADQRANHDRALSRQMADAIQDAQQSALPSGLVDLRDLDGSAVPLLRSDSFTVAADPVAVDSQITLGPVGVNLSQLLQSLKRTLTRPGETELTGIVQSDETGVRVSLQGRRGIDKLGPWNATAPNRDEAIRSVAKQYAIQCAHARKTSNPASHRAYCEAVQRLDFNPGKDALVEARTLLERALAYDHANLPARLRLGAVLRLLGDNVESAYQLDLLLDDIRDRDGLPPLARDLVDAQPELEYIARYERNIALAKVPDRQRDARIGLKALVTALEPKQDDPTLGRLYSLALAAWGAAYLGVGKDELSREAVLRRLDELAARLERGGGNGARREAMAVLDNARARILFRLDRLGDARKAADHALAIMPDLTDARITLASINMKTRDDRGAWIEPTRRQLERAMEISPEDPRLLYRLGRFYDLLDDNEQAKHFYGQIPHDWKALDRHADVLEREEAFDAALKLRVRAHRIRPATDARAAELIDAFLHAARSSEDDIEAVVACAAANLPDGDRRLGEIDGHAVSLRAARAPVVAAPV